MTLVGKIFAFAIAVFSVIFLALSTIVYSTATNWKKKSDDAQTKITKLQGDVTKAKAESEQRSRDFDAAKKDHNAEVETLKNQIAKLETDNKEFQNQVTQNRTLIEQKTQTANNSLAEAEAMRTEAEKLRETLANIQSLTNRYKEAQLELQDKVVELTRDLNVAKNNNADLRKRAALVSSLREDLQLLSGELNRPGTPPALKPRLVSIRQKIEQGLVDDSQVKVALGPPQTLQGEVTKVDPKGRYVELNVGSDDYLVPGHRLYIRRGDQFIGDITIQSVDEDRSLAEVTYSHSGRKPQEGDVVKPKK